jgi:hypothetical protein
LRHQGLWLVFIAHRPVLTLSQPALARAIDDALAEAGALAPLREVQ